MMFKKLIFLTLISIVPFSGRAVAQPAWERMPAAPFERNFQQVAAAASGKNVFLLSETNAYGTEDRGLHWRSLLRLTGNGRMRRIYAAVDGSVFILTSEGIFKSEDGGKKWRRIFSGLSRQDTDTLTLAEHPEDPEILLAGTGRGIYWTLDGGESWTKEENALSSEKIVRILPHPAERDLIFAATEDSVYRSADGGRVFERTFRIPSSPGQFEDGDETLEEEASPGSGTSVISALAVSPTFPETIYLGTARGVYQSVDAGKSWRPLSASGLRSRRITDLAVSARETVYASTAAGVYRLPSAAGRWEELREGFAGSAVLSLGLFSGDGTDTLMAVTENGIFRWEAEWPGAGTPFASAFSLQPESAGEFQKLLEREPSVLDVQRAAIRYCDAGNAKIRRWHLASRLKALVPHLTLGRDLSIRKNIDIDRAGTNDPDRFIIGPDEITRDKDLNFTWELGDLIWSTDQTSIDSRSKLNAEFRVDLMGDVTRLYFERRRLLMELFLAPPAADKERLDLLLKIDELTAHLDSFTDGYLTRELERRGIRYA